MSTILEHSSKPNTASAPPRSRLYTWLTASVWILLLLGVLFVAGTFFVLSKSDLPTLTELENPKSELATEVYAADGSTLGRYYVENRVAVRYEYLNPAIIDALLATEDERHHQHAGIDWWGLGRAVARMGKDGGASTISQQLAKLMFTGQAASGVSERIVQKLKEWIIATRLERNYTKEEILAMYLNKFEFNYGAFGIEAASETYFSKPQKALTVDEAAMLIGMLKSPSYYSPNRHPQRAALRREVVLKQMVRADKLNAVAYDSLRQRPLGLRMNRQTHVDGPAPYFRMELRKAVRRILADPSLQRADGTSYDVNRDGLRIYTTIDPAYQALAEEAAWEHMTEVQATYRDVWKTRDPWTYRDKIGTEEQTTQAELDYRANRLAQSIRASERYEHLEQAMLNDLYDETATKYEGWQLRGLDIERLIDEESGGNRIARLTRSNSIGETLEGNYRQLLSDEDLWPRLKEAFEGFEKELDRQFETPTEMKVFAYNEAHEVDTVLSPLDSIKYMRSFLQIGSMAVEPSTGFVKAWVGGVDHRWFPLDHVQSRRQVGSTFKPFIYATAISQQGISPCYRVADLPQTIRAGEGGFQLLEDWAPQNSDGKFTGDYLSLMQALRLSKNTVSVYLMKQLSNVDPVRGLIHNMGIDSSERYSNGRHVIPLSPSIALRSPDLSVEEMAGAYTTFSNNGTYVKPVVVQRIEDKYGKVLYEAIPEERTALDPVSNYTMVRMLQYAGANGRYFGGVETPYGGKTGTTNDYVDGWYMGITPKLIVGTWVGGDERFIRFLNIRYGQGGYMARPFFARFLKKIEANAEELDWDKTIQFEKPSGAYRIEYDCDNVPFSANPFASTGSDSTSTGRSNNPFGDQTFGNDPLGNQGFDDDPFGDQLPVPVDTISGL